VADGLFDDEEEDEVVMVGIGTVDVKVGTGAVSRTREVGALYKAVVCARRGVSGRSAPQRGDSKTYGGWRGADYDWHDTRAQNGLR
jgi:hypothetical protein